VPAAIRDRERLTIADPDGKRPVWRLLDDGNLRVAELIDLDEALL
jgi:hypothetical protein